MSKALSVRDEVAQDPEVVQLSHWIMERAAEVAGDRLIVKRVEVIFAMAPRD